jgi:hypothetical protein
MPAVALFSDLGTDVGQQAIDGIHRRTLSSSAFAY